MFDANQFRTLIVQPALDNIALHSLEAEELLMATCAQESLGGTYLSQLNGPAKGIYQMETKTHDSLWNTVLVRDECLRFKIMKALNTAINPNASRLVWDLNYATYMARVFYRNVPEALPPANDIDLIWQYYKSYWNTNLGAAKKTAFVQNYNNFLGIKK